MSTPLRAYAVQISHVAHACLINFCSDKMPIEYNLIRVVVKLISLAR
jgi:hypothetical protein